MLSFFGNEMEVPHLDVELPRLVDIAEDIRASSSATFHYYQNTTEEDSWEEVRKCEEASILQEGQRNLDYIPLHAVFILTIGVGRGRS